MERQGGESSCGLERCYTRILCLFPSDESEVLRASRREERGLEINGESLGAAVLALVRPVNSAYLFLAASRPVSNSQKKSFCKMSA